MLKNYLILIVAILFSTVFSSAQEGSIEVVSIIPVKAIKVFVADDYAYIVFERQR